MEYVKLGRTVLDVSRLTLGCMTYGAPDRGLHTWTLDEEASRPLIRKALDSRAQGALAWVIQKPGVTGPIIGASNNKPQHLDDAVARAPSATHAGRDRVSGGAVCTAAHCWVRVRPGA